MEISMTKSFFYSRELSWKPGLPILEPQQVCWPICMNDWECLAEFHFNKMDLCRDFNAIRFPNVSHTRNQLIVNSMEAFCIYLDVWYHLVVIMTWYRGLGALLSICHIFTTLSSNMFMIDKFIFWDILISHGCQMHILYAMLNLYTIKVPPR